MAKGNSPANWQPLPTNNSANMQWFQNSTKSFFAIVNPAIEMIVALYLDESAMAQSFADQGVLESADHIAFGHSNYDHRYFLNVFSHSDIVAHASFLLYVDRYKGLSKSDVWGS